MPKARVTKKGNTTTYHLRGKGPQSRKLPPKKTLVDAWRDAKSLDPGSVVRSKGRR